MRISLACLLALVALPAGVLAQDAPVNKQVHDTPAVRGSIIANLNPTFRIDIPLSCTR